MSYTESFLTRAIAKSREHIDEPLVNKKYTDARVIEMLEHSYTLVINEVNRNAQTPIVASITVTPSGSTYDYILPYTVGSIEGIFETDSLGTKVFYSRRSNYNPLGVNLRVEGNVLHIQTPTMYGLGTSLTVEYTPSGTAR